MTRQSQSQRNQYQLSLIHDNVVVDVSNSIHDLLPFVASSGMQERLQRNKIKSEFTVFSEATSTIDFIKYL